jgi:cellulose biosynthesis protein BcsQ
LAKIINLFNHKGGVSKTTTVFNLSWMLGLMGKRVLIADFDPQCNLTGMVLGYKGVDDLEDSYQSDPPNNLKDALSPAFESKPKQIVGAECVEVPGNSNIFLLPGHIGMAEYETTLGIAQELSGSLAAAPCSLLNPTIGKHRSTVSIAVVRRPYQTVTRVEGGKKMPVDRQIQALLNKDLGCRRRTR